MRLLVVANCQGGPVAHLLRTFFAPADIRVIVVHQHHDANRRNAEEALAESLDAVLTQPIRDDYPFEAVRTTEVRRLHGSAVITWPNAYFRGYNPELIYLRVRQLGLSRAQISGPLGEYHLETVLEAWRSGLGVEEAVERLVSADYNERVYGSVPDESLAELRARERDLDVTLCDWLESSYLKARLFHTFNHPSNRVLHRLAAGLAARVGLAQRYAYEDDLLPELLGEIRLPVSPAVRRRMGLPEAGNRVYAGFRSDGAAQAGDAGRMRLYTDREIVEAFFAMYRELLPGRLSEAAAAPARS